MVRKVKNINFTAIFIEKYCQNEDTIKTFYKFERIVCTINSNLNPLT